jgi:HTH-type transcriptional regulator/antitoxin HipB
MRLNTPQTLSVVIRDQRKTQKLTQKETADRVGIKQTTVSGFENNPDQCKIETLFKLLSALDLELHITRRGQQDGKGNSRQQLDAASFETIV